MNEKLWTIPNIFTLSRVFFIYPVFLLISNGHLIFGLLLLLFSLLTDFLDGYIARKFNQASMIGALLDPVCDKAVILAYLTLILFSTDLLPLWFVALVYTRNISQLMSIPILSWWLKIPFKVKPKQLPKWGTAFSFIIMFLGVFVFGQEVLGRELLVSESKFLTFWFLIPISALLEAYILITYLPRLVQIATGKHDTFE